MKRGGIKAQNKKGLSDIVTTLIIIVLSLVAIGIIWVVVRNLVESGAEQIDVSQKCLSVELSAVRVNESSSGVYDVTLKRGSDSQGDIGVKVNIFQGTTLNSGVLNFGAVGDLDAIGTTTKTVNTNADTATPVIGGDKIEFTAFFLDDASGNEQLCSQTKSFPF
ncbi:MAG: hypothetical protein AABW87_01760 [Nanoarchaeota archaeon]